MMCAYDSGMWQHPQMKYLYKMSRTRWRNCFIIYNAIKRPFPSTLLIRCILLLGMGYRTRLGANTVTRIYVVQYWGDGWVTLIVWNQSLLSVTDACPIIHRVGIWNPNVGEWLNRESLICFCLIQTSLLAVCSPLFPLLGTLVVAPGQVVSPV